MIKIGDTLEGIIRINSSKSGFFSNENLEKDLYVFKKNLNTSLNNDKVKIEVVEGFQSKFEGKVIEILERNTESFVCKVEKNNKKTHAYTVNKNIHQKFILNKDDADKVKEGEIIVVKILKWTNPNKTPIGQLIKIIGNQGEHETEIHTILEDYQLPYEFPQEVLNEAELISEVITQKEIDKRLDYRNILTFTIDGYDSKDLDDALSVQWVNGNIEVGIHIADVTHYIKPDTLLDKELMSRSTSIYLVDRTIPMIPRKLSNDLCSLNPNTDKLVYSFIFTLDNKGNVIKEHFEKGIINSNYRLTYDEVQEVLEGGETHNKELKSALLDLNNYAKKIRKNRLKNNKLNFKGSEIKFKLDENNKPIELIFKEQKDSNWLIEDYMVLTNMRVAEFISKKELKSIHRSHDKPDPTRLESLKTFVNSIGYKLNLNDEENVKQELNNLLEQVKNTNEESIINNLSVRCMAKANYQTLNIGHYGLGLQYYSHTTSPIRRASDVIVHRQLTEIIYKDKIETKGLYNTIDSKCSHISTRERLAAQAERDSIKYMQCIYLSDKIGKTYKGIISSITEKGLFVDIPENGCNGFIMISNIEGDKYVADVKNHCVKGSFGQKLKLGDEINIIISSVDIENKFINLSLVNF